MFFIWAGFIVLILALLALDLGVFHRQEHAVGVREALIWTAVWIASALAFNVLVYFMYENHWLGIGKHLSETVSGTQAAKEFFAGYVLEKSLSMDNIFVIALIMRYFAVPAIYQHRVLFWGILGAMVMRGVMIGIGAAMITRFAWTLYFFGGLLIITAIKMLITDSDSIEPDRNPWVRLARRFYPVTPRFEGRRFFTHYNGQRAITPLFLALIVIESTDLLFAIDSIPAIFGLTQDPFIVFTSNIFAILGLRSMYFALAGLMEKFRYLKVSLVFLLIFVGVKMLVHDHYHIDADASLAIILGTLAVGVIASIMANRRDALRSNQGPPGNDGHMERS